MREKVAPILAAFENIQSTVHTASSSTHSKNSFLAKLLQSIISISAPEGEGGINQTTYTLMLEWATTWAYCFNKTVEFLDLLHNHPSIPNRHKTRQTIASKHQQMRLPTSHLSYTHKSLYYQFVTCLANYWSIFFQQFINPKVEVKIRGNHVQILGMTQEMKSFNNDPHQQDHAVVSIPLHYLDNKNLLLLYAVSILSQHIFLQCTPTDHLYTYSECKLDSLLNFEGAHLIRHYFLLMVSGIMQMNYHQIFFIYHTIRAILSTFPIVKCYLQNATPIYFNNMTNYDEKWPSYDITCNSEWKQFEAYQWVVQMYCDLLSMEGNLWSDPEALLTCVTKYCECKHFSSSSCCKMCHFSCGKWSYLAERCNKQNAGGDFKFILGDSGTFPNLLLPQFSVRFFTKKRQGNVTSCHQS